MSLLFTKPTLADLKDPMDICLRVPEIEEAYRLALSLWTYYEEKNKGKPLYAYKNSLEGHFIGKLGEQAAYQWAQKLCRDRPGEAIPYYKTNNGKCDIQVGVDKWEVKSWRLDAFPEMGYAINEAQWNTIQNHANKIVWCGVPVSSRVKEASEILSLAMDEERLDITLCGWNNVSDFTFIKPVERWGLLSRQLPTIEQINMVCFL